MSPVAIPPARPAARSTLGAAVLESDSAEFTAVADIAGLYLPAMFPEGESFEVSFAAKRLSGSTNWTVTIVDVDSGLAVATDSNLVAGNVFCRAIIPPGKASASYKVRGLSSAGNGKIEASLTAPATLVARRL